MNIGLNTKVLLSLLLVSLMSLGLYGVGLFNTHLDLLSSRSGFSYHSTSNSSDISKLNYANNRLSMQCTVKSMGGFRFCGIAIRLNESLGSGINLSGYDEIILDVEYQSATQSDSLRLQFRNFNQKYSTADDSQSLKHNSLRLVSADISPDKPIAMRALQVPEWWIIKRKIGHENSQRELNSVSRIELRTTEIIATGDYALTIKRFVLRGKLFSEYTMIKCLLVLWLMVSIYLIRREHSILKWTSNRDPLTKTINRRGLNDRLNHYFSSRKIKHEIVLFFIDIDDFKKVNDSYGHVVGDELLCVFCRLIELELSEMAIGELTKDYFLARLSGDEFALVFYDIDNQLSEKIANQILIRFAGIITIFGIELRINASIGIAKSSDRINSPDVLMSNADTAMYHAKKSGKNQYKIFDQELSDDQNFRKKISIALRSAIEAEQFTLCFMPIYDSESLHIRGAEILIRATAAELHGIDPGVFIPIAEEYGLVREIDMWVIETCFQYIANASAGIKNKDLLFSINISALELTNKVFPRQLKRLLEKYEIDPKWIELELTETSLINVDEHSVGIFHELKRQGIALSLDDFGTGYTSFSQLLNYPVNRIKIDMSFVRDLCDRHTGDSRMVDVILAMAQSYDLTVVAEGVESQYQLNYLRENKCDYLQGYFMSKPMSWDNFMEQLARKPNAENLSLGRKEIS